MWLSVCMYVYGIKNEVDNDKMCSVLYASMLCELAVHVECHSHQCSIER